MVGEEHLKVEALWKTQRPNHEIGLTMLARRRPNDSRGAVRPRTPTGERKRNSYDSVSRDEVVGGRRTGVGRGRRLHEQ